MQTKFELINFYLSPVELQSLLVFTALIVFFTALQKKIKRKHNFIFARATIYANKTDI